MAIIKGKSSYWKYRSGICVF